MTTKAYNLNQALAGVNACLVNAKFASPPVAQTRVLLEQLSIALNACGEALPNNMEGANARDKIDQILGHLHDLNPYENEPQHLQDNPFWVLHRMFAKGEANPEEIEVVVDNDVVSLEPRGELYEKNITRWDAIREEIKGFCPIEAHMYPRDAIISALTLLGINAKKC